MCNGIKSVSVSTIITSLKSCASFPKRAFTNAFTRSNINRRHMQFARQCHLVKLLSNVSATFVAVVLSAMLDSSIHPIPSTKCALNREIPHCVLAARSAHAVASLGMLLPRELVCLPNKQALGKLPLAKDRFIPSLIEGSPWRAYDSSAPLVVTFNGLPPQPLSAVLLDETHGNSFG